MDESPARAYPRGWSLTISSLLRSAYAVRRTPAASGDAHIESGKDGRSAWRDDTRGAGSIPTAQGRDYFEKGNEHAAHCSLGIYRLLDLQGW